MTAARVDISWTPPGPVSAAFRRSRARVKVINGPIGSGKTTTCLMDGVLMARAQMPSTRDQILGPRGKPVPVRKFKLCVVRDTYRQLWKTTMQSWFRRFPKEVGDFTGQEGAPATHKLLLGLDDGSVAALHVDFVAIGENAVEDVLRGYEPTAFYLNEADLLAREVFTYAFGRTGRFPDMAEGGPSWHGLLVDCNAPEEESWLYRDVFTLSREELEAKGIALFRQPSGLSAQAENLANLPPGYYADQLAIQPAWYISRFIENKPGYSRAGKPVYPEFVDTLHVPERELRHDPRLKLVLGIDAGMSPSCIFGQRGPAGQWRILDELVAEHGTGPTRFSEALAQRLQERFPDVEEIEAWADPSSAYGADAHGGEQSWLEIVAHLSKLRIRAAPTNKPIPRWEAVRKPLMRLIDGAPAFQLSPRCKVLRLGFNSGYRFRKVVGSVDRFTEEAEKNDFSHPHDALQYLCSGGGEDSAIRGRDERQAAGRRAAQPDDHSWDPLA